MLHTCCYWGIPYITFSAEQISQMPFYYILDVYHKNQLGTSDLSINILRAGDKLPMRRCFFTNSTGDLLAAIGLPGGLYNFCDFVIIFSLMLVTMIWKRVTYFTDSEMIECYQKKCGWNSKSTKTKN